MIKTLWRNDFKEIKISVLNQESPGGRDCDCGRIGESRYQSGCIGRVGKERN